METFYTEPHVRDRYDQEVERLSRRSLSQIYDAWMYGEEHSPLFDACGRSRDLSMADYKSDLMCGCLTQVRSGERKAQSKELTALILDDDRLPDSINDLDPTQHLPVFAEWQRRLDHELDRTPPPMLPE